MIRPIQASGYGILRTRHSFRHCRIFHRMLLRRIWKDAAMNFFVSTGLRDMALGMGKPKGVVVFPACPSPEILAYPMAGGENTENRYFLFLGRFDTVKNPMLLLQAGAFLPAKSAGIYRYRYGIYIRKSQANAALIYAAILCAKQLGFAYFDLGGITVGAKPGSKDAGIGNCFQLSQAIGLRRTSGKSFSRK